MTGLNDCLKIVRAQTKQCVAQFRGKTFDYHLFTDVTVRPPTISILLAIPGIPTETEEVAKLQDGVVQDETLDEFIFSREALKVAGVFHVPTTQDFFFIAGDTLVKHNVRKIITETTDGFFRLFVNVKRRIRPKG